MALCGLGCSPKPATSGRPPPKGIAVSVTRHDLSQVGSVWDRGGGEGGCQSVSPLIVNLS